MARLHQTETGKRTDEPTATQATLLEPGYLTDGKSLFHVERTLLDDPHGELLVELEDCATLEIIVCSAQVVAELDMRSVEPSQPVAA